VNGSAGRVEGFKLVAQKSLEKGRNREQGISHGESRGGKGTRRGGAEELGNNFDWGENKTWGGKKGRPLKRVKSCAKIDPDGNTEGYLLRKRRTAKKARRKKD